MNIARNSKGFTLIEIVVVIAIAALILAAILIFVPQAQVTQRDGQRKSDVAKILAKLTECQANNGGNVCTDTTSFSSAAYLTGINPPGSATPYTVTQFTAGSAPANNTSPCPTGAGTSTAAVYTNASNIQAVVLCLEATSKTYKAGSN